MWVQYEKKENGNILPGKIIEHKCLLVRSVQEFLLNQISYLYKLVLCSVLYGLNSKSI